MLTVWSDMDMELHNWRMHCFLQDTLVLHSIDLGWLHLMVMEAHLQYYMKNLNSYLSYQNKVQIGHSRVPFKKRSFAHFMLFHSFSMY